eukprot:SAG31_NODE_27857_length_419_cov_0.646875_1_plen_139_part_11
MYYASPGRSRANTPAEAKPRGIANSTRTSTARREDDCDNDATVLVPRRHTGDVGEMVKGSADADGKYDAKFVDQPDACAAQPDARAAQAGATGRVLAAKRGRSRECTGALKDERHEKAEIVANLQCEVVAGLQKAQTLE